MKRCILLVFIFVFCFSLFCCKEEHIHQFIDYKCECGEVSNVTVKKIINNDVYTIEVKYGEKLDEFIKPNLDGFEFIGWFVLDKEFDFNSEIKEEIEIVARFKEIYQVKFIDYNGAVLNTQYVLSGDSCSVVNNPAREYFEFVGWDKDVTCITSDLEVNAIYKPLDISFNIDYVIDDVYLNYSSKEEMIFDFLNDFYDFVNPKESRLTFINGFDGSIGTWENYIGGSVSSINKLIYNNDIDASNDEYFFNSNEYKDKWYPLSSYLKNYVFKSNKRFGYPDVLYNYGALDFKRYIIDNPDKYLDTYGGEDIFYGFPKFDFISNDSYKYGDQFNLGIPNSIYFEGWYLDSTYQDGPYLKLPEEIVGDIKLYGKTIDEFVYTITLNSDSDDEFDDILVSKGQEVNLPVPSKEGFEFLGWEIDYQILDNQFVYQYNVSIDLKAKWKSNSLPNLETLVYEGEAIKYRNSYIPVEIIDTYQEKDEEFRAAWVSSFTGCFKPSTDIIKMKDELLNVLDVMESFNMNAILFHLRTHNNAFYKTKLAPIKEEYGTFESFDEWDYLPWFIEECHKRGIEFHAWLNPYRIALSGYSLDKTTQDVSKMYQDYPLNPASKKENILMTIASDKESLGAILDPSKEEVRKYIVDVCLELMNNYDIDGIHFDDYFYARLSNSLNILDDCDQADYELYIDNFETSFKKDSEEDKKDWRRLNVDTLIFELHNEITSFNRLNNSSVEFGISPTGIYKSGDGSVSGGSNTTSSGHFDKYLFSDTVKWVKEGWIDYILPQCYTSFNNYNYSFQDITSWWNKVVEGTGTRLYIGLGAHKPVEQGYQYSWATEKNEALNQLRYLQGLNNVDGVCFFSYNCFKSVLDDNTNIANYAFNIIRDEYWVSKVDNPKTRASIYE